MTGTLRVFRAELVRLLRTRAVWFTGAVLALLSTVRVLASVATTVVSGGENPVSSGAAWAPFVDGWRTGLVLGGLVLLLFASRSIAGDREHGILRLAVTKSATRPALVFGRLCLAPLLVVGVVAATGLAAGITAAQYGDFGPLIEDGYELFPAAELRAELTRAVLASLPALIATFAFGLMVSACSRTAIGAVAWALGIFLAFDLFKEALGDDGYWVFAAYAPTLADGSAMGEMAGVARGFSDSGFPESLYSMSLALPLPEALILAGLAAWILSRRPL